MNVGYKNRLYWLSQFVGWGGLTTIYALVHIFQNKLSITKIIFLSSFFIVALGLTHLFRWVVIGGGWLNKRLEWLVPRVLIAVLIKSTILVYSISIVQGAGLYLLENKVFALESIYWSFGEMLIQFVNSAVFFFIWSCLYLGFHYFEKSRLQEIERLKLSASTKEVELNSLKYQLNPHFMFNSLNSIRALIGENPDKAKTSITKLSNVLRGALSMGQEKLVPFETELDLVKNYLEMEKIRFEERLRISYHIHPDSFSIPFPPLLLQTLVENCVKHGISKLVDGGVVSVSTYVNEYLHVTLVNSGVYSPIDDRGIGLVNTRQRIELLFGTEGHFQIEQDGEFVNASLRLPVKSFK